MRGIGTQIKTTMGRNRLINLAVIRIENDIEKNTKTVLKNLQKKYFFIYKIKILILRVIVLLLI